MQLFGGFLKNRALGIDLGSRYMKIIEIEKKADKLELLNYSITSLNWESPLGHLLGTSQLFEENLGRLLREGTKNMKTKDAVFVLPSPFLFSSFFSLPDLPQKTLTATISSEAKRYIPLTMDEVVITFKLFQFRNPFEENQTRWLVFLVGIPKSLTRKLKLAADLAGLNFKSGQAEFFTREPFFTLKTGAKQQIDDSSQCSIAIDFGVGYSSLVLLCGSQVLFSKKLKFKLYDVIEHVSKLMGVSLDKSEEMLIQQGFNMPAEMKNLKESLENHINLLSAEVEQEIKEIQEKFGFRVVKLYLSGGAVNIPGFLDYLKAPGSKINFLILNAFDYLQNVPQREMVLKKGPVFAGAVGACSKYFFD